MDTSFWIQYNPKISVTHTTKKFFGKYLYKLVVYCPAGRLIDSKPNVLMADALAHRREVSKNVNHGGWWGYRYNKDLENADISFLNLIRDIRQNRTLGVKLRVEEPRIQIYAETDKQLHDLVNKHFDTAHSIYVESVSGPEDAVAESILNSGAIIRKTDLGYKYKVILRDGKYDTQIKESLLSYLNNLGPDDVKLSKTGFEMLQKSSSFIWNLYFFTNDPSVTTFLNLISPGIVSNIHELVVLEHK